MMSRILDAINELAVRCEDSSSIGLMLLVVDGKGGVFHTSVEESPRLLDMPMPLEEIEKRSIRPMLVMARNWYKRSQT